MSRTEALADPEAALPVPKVSNRRTAEQTRGLVLAAAREQIVHSGIAELHVAAVARSSGVSETLIYRYFKSRTGLLEEVLADLWEEQGARTLTAVEELLDGADTDEVSLRRVVAALPIGHDPDTAVKRGLMLQTLAAATTLPELRRRIARVQRDHDARIEQVVATALRASAPDVRASTVRTIRALITAVALGSAMTDLNPATAPEDDDVRGLLALLLSGLTAAR